MYTSPIEMIAKEIRTIQEEAVYKAVQEVGIIVDKQELLRALKYDRDQYNRGYHDGFIAASMLAEDIKEGVAREIFEEIENTLNQWIELYYTITVSTFDSIEQAKARSSESVLRAFRDYLAELKKKYTEGE